MNTLNQTCNTQSRKQIRIGVLRFFVIAVTIAGLFLFVSTSLSNAAPGDLDPTFGNGGIVIGQGNSLGLVRSMAIQADGKIVAAGTGDDGNYFYNFVAVRYQGGSNANIRTHFDFDGDGRADISVFRPTDRVWYLNQSTQGFSATQFGLSTDKITPADFDGDGKTDVAVFRPSTGVWWLNQSTSGLTAMQFGLNDDIPVPSAFVP